MVMLYRTIATVISNGFRLRISRGPTAHMTKYAAHRANMGEGDCIRNQSLVRGSGREFVGGEGKSINKGNP